MKVKIEQFKQVYKHAPMGIIGQAIVVLIITLVLFKNVPDKALLIWSCLSLSILLYRAISIYRIKPYFKYREPNKEIRKWFRTYQITMFLSGLLWGSSVYFVDYYQPLELHFFLIATVFALSGAAIATLGSIFSIYIAFTLPMLSIMAISLLITNKPAYIEAGLLVFVGSFFLIYTAYQNSHNIFKLFKRTIEVEQAHKDIINRLGMAGEYRDNETGFHVKRVSYCSYLLALQANLTLAQAEQILLVSPMHDVGKIGISDKILLKPGKLTPDEWDTMQKHTSIGEMILGNHNSNVMKLAASIAAYHHEKWDGSGYPAKLSGKEIPIEPRIVSICDVFDALISVRPYKKAWSTKDAIQYINDQSGMHFDPELVKKFMEIIDQVLNYAEKNNDKFSEPQLVSTATVTN